ncbi:glycosyltransferase [Hydrogenovibrio sp. JE_KL2]|uniref:glycosyltransferase family 2 protein n=1 Tax=Hydrogenovibrio sp. JE_KL2 TaxID=2651188 RepID=UPI00128C30A0|nr:glycosyltransferase [Hydrogenovibrio sp. JE_KL2]MPQ75466.1 hypothetical protein [Hydrogenovibrio sp. JE_KL2]
MLVSVILPSLRKQEAEEVVHLIDNELSVCSDEYEIILVSPFPIHGDRIVNVVETTPKGVLNAMQLGYLKSKGDYIIPWSDDAKPVKGSFFQMFECISNVHQENTVFAFRRFDSSGRRLYEWQVFGVHYAGWFCASRKTINNAGGFFSADFVNFWADPDFCLRVNEIGGGVHLCKSAVILVDQKDDDVKSSNLSLSFFDDYRTFLRKWQGLASAYDVSDWENINTVIPETFSEKVRFIFSRIKPLKKLWRSMF